MPLPPPAADILAAAYRDARYVARLPDGERAVRVGERPAALEAAIEGGNFAFLTAWNPHSRRCDEGANRAAAARLEAELDRLGLHRWPMRASAVDGDWAEPGWLLADIDATTLDRLAREFGQAGTLSWRRGEPVRLRLLLARPPGTRADATDWLE